MLLQFLSTAQSSQVENETLDDFDKKMGIVEADDGNEKDVKAFRAKEAEQLKKSQDAINKNNMDPKSTFELEENEMSDMPDEEFEAERAGAKHDVSNVRATGGFLPPESMRNDPVNRAIMADFHKQLEEKYPLQDIPEEYDPRGKLVLY